MTPHKHPRLVELWLLACIACVVAMVFIGGVTRLTESGLSIVEWKLVSGILPPIGDVAWEKEFEAYQSSPEFQKKNFDFTVSDFKRIFWLEYLHRLLGRITGMVLLVPFAFLLMKRALPAPLARRMFYACLLVAAQGTVGWIMVASGLVNDPRVNPAKLTLHLMLALALFSLLLWTYWQVRARAHVEAPCCGVKFIHATLALLLIQLALGALVAGNDAGLTYNTYPLMDGKLVPSSLFVQGGFITNIVLVQFAHRLVAHLVVLAAITMLFFGWKVAALRPALKLFGAIVAGQFLLGVFTLLHAVPVALGSAHQMGAVALLAATLNLAYLARVQQTR